MAQRLPAVHYGETAVKRILAHSLPAALVAAIPLGLAADRPVPSWEARFTNEEITIDGKVDEEVWHETPALSFFVPVTHEPATTQTEGRILWDETHLYVSFIAEDGDLRAEETRRNHPVHLDDVLEFFFQVQGEEEYYYNIEINALGTVLDSRGGNPQGFDFENLRHALELRGTLNDTTERDEGWSLEVAIPFSDIVELDGNPPQPGDRWKFHMSRYDYDDKKFEDGVELTSTAALTRVNFHYHADWQEIVFVGPDPAEEPE